MRLLRALRVHLQMASTMLRVGTGHDGKPSMSPLTESRDLVEPLTLCTDLPVPAGRKYVAPFSLTVPEAQLLPTLPGQLDYHVVARAAVDGHAVGAWAQTTLVMLGGSATSSTLAPGDPCTATSPTGSRDAAMVVEVRGAVTLVQWLDGRLATWVRTADVERA